MVFKRLLGAFGVGGPSVETVLHESHGRPGGHLPGEVTIQGGDHDVHVQQVVLSLVTNVEFEHGDHEGAAGVEFYRGAIAGGFHLGAGQYHSIPFQMPLPWELPLTEVYGQHLHGMAMGVRTELEIAGARDAGDLDPVSIGPLPSQQRVLDAFGALGFQFKSADVEQGHIAGVHQELPFYQEIEFYAPPQYSGQINEVELTFVANPHELAVVLEADRRGTIFSEGDDVFGRFHVSHDEALHMAWEQELENWLRAVAGHLHGGHGGFAPVHHDAHHGVHHGVHHDVHHGHHGSHGHGGPGWGGVAAGAAAGFVAGAVVNELLDDDDDDDEDDGGDGLAEAMAEAQQQAIQDAYRQAAYEAAYEQAYEDAYEEAVEAFEDED
ncbi:sporulation protein [Actinomadura keratinilytica]|uniref:Sporulation protein n=1 Tax=Actinomadura keratinilytica TaxID=547461 RepID=A0ABP7Z410_9ACTN